MAEAIKFLNDGKIGVIPTDTLYGLVGRALNRETVERIYKVRRRSPNKPMIILISSPDDLRLFGVGESATETKFSRFWPGKVSIIFPITDKNRQEKFFYLHRGTNTLAFRLPNKKGLIDLLNKTGPLVAPSANPEGLPPAKTIKEAKNYFGDEVYFYIDGGKIHSSPSKLIKIDDDKITELRK